MAKSTPYRSLPAAAVFDQQKLIRFVEAETKTACNEADIRQNLAKEVKPDYKSSMSLGLALGWIVLVKVFDPDTAHPVPALAFLVASILGLVLGAAWAVGWRRYRLQRMVRSQFVPAADVLVRHWRAEIARLETLSLGDEGLWSKLVYQAVLGEVNVKPISQLIAIEARHERLFGYLRDIVSEADVLLKEYTSGTGPSEDILLQQLEALAKEFNERVRSIHQLLEKVAAQIVIHDPSIQQAVVAVIEMVQTLSVLNLPRVVMEKHVEPTAPMEEVEIRQYEVPSKRTA